jgi:hypothetical protein
VVISAAVCAGCVVLASVTLLVPSAPTTDPWGWIVWGREIVHFHLDTKVLGTPSWKPLPVLVTAPLALGGGAAPMLWVLFARAGGLLGLVVAFRLAGRLVGDRGVAARWASGTAAAVGLVLSMGWMRAFSHGYSEPLAVALVLGSIDRHLAGRPRQAFVLGGLVCGTRPEAFPLLALYGLWLYRRSNAGVGLLAAVLVGIPAAWLIPDWVGSGDPFYGSKLAHAVLTSTRQDLGAALRIVPIPYSLAAIAATVLAGRQGDRTFVQIALLAGVWAALLRLLILAGYPPSDRFFFLPAVIVCVLGAAGLVRIALAVPVRWLRAAVAVALLGLVAWSFGPRIKRAADVAESSAARARTESELWRAVTKAGGSRLRGCGASAVPGGLRWLRGVVAWRLALPLGKTYNVPETGGLRTIARLTRGTPDDIVGGTVTVRLPRRAAVLFLPFANMNVRFSGGPAGTKPRQLASDGHWSVYATDVHRCPGGLGLGRLSRPAGAPGGRSIASAPA